MAQRSEIEFPAIMIRRNFDLYNESRLALLFVAHLGKIRERDLAQILTELFQNQDSGNLLNIDGAPIQHTYLTCSWEHFPVDCAQTE